MNRLPALFLLALALVPGPAPAQLFYDSPAYQQLRRAGRQVVVERELDITGDARAEVVVVERGPAGIGLSAWSRTGTGLTLLGRVPARAADELVKLEVLELAAGQAALWFETSERNPDEDDHLLTLHRAAAGGLSAIFTAGFRVVHPENEAGRTARRLVQTAHGRVGVSVLPRRQGWPRLVLRRDARLLRLTGGGRALWLLAGMYEDVYLPEKGGYQLAQSRFVDFLAPLPAGQSVRGRVWEFTLSPGQALRLVRFYVRAAAAERCLAWIQLGAAGGEGKLHWQKGRPVVGGLVSGAGEFTPAGRPQIHQLLLVFEPPLTVERLRLELKPAPGAAWPDCLEKIELLRDRPEAASTRTGGPDSF